MMFSLKFCDIRGFVFVFLKKNLTTPKVASIETNYLSAVIVSILKMYFLKYLG